jgi:hypothetical protein
MLGFVRQSLRWQLRAAWTFLSHFALAAFFLLLVVGSEAIYGYFYPDQGPLLFDALPVKWLFDVAKLATFGVFVIHGTIEAWNSFKHGGE